MTLADLTRNCFQGGISASKWVGLCKLYISTNPSNSHENIETSLSNSVLVLFRSYPGEPDLQEYLKYAIQDGIISVSAYVATLLQAARSPELHNSATLDMLCRAALDAHYSSGLPPIGSVIAHSVSPIAVLGTVQDALALLRTAHTLPMSHFHQLTTSASEIVILLLSCVTNMSQVSTAQAMVNFAEANDVLQNFRLSTDLRQVLETFVLSLSLLIGDDAKAAREAQMMQTIQLALGKSDIFGASSETDLITFSLLFNHLLFYRARDFGSGSGADPVAFLVGTFRWTLWTPTVFYTQMLLSSFTCLSRSPFRTSILWRALIVGRLPRLLVIFENVVRSDSVTDADWRSALQVASTATFQRSDLMTQCDRVLSQSRTDVHDDPDISPRSLPREFLQQLVLSGLINQSFVDSSIVNDAISKLSIEAQEAGFDLESYMETKLTPDTSLEDTRVWIERVWRDPGSHAAFSEATRKRFIAHAAILDVESLSHLCKVMYSYEPALDIMSLHVQISDLIFYALLFLEEYDCETVGDPQTAVSHLGDVVLFVQFTLLRFHFNSDTFSMGGRTLSSSYLRSTAAVYPIDELSGADAIAFSAWYKALFDSNSEGIEDTILRSTHPKTLLCISATLFSHAITASSEHKIDGDVLHNGVSYFLGPLLNWTLVGTVGALIREIQQKGISAPEHLEILQSLILSQYCPLPVLCICGPRILSLLDKKIEILGDKFDTDSIRNVITQSLGLANESGGQESLSLGPQIVRQEQARHAIREALAMARAGKAPFIDIERCLIVTPPNRFLQSLWLELTMATSLGEIEACRRLATFILTMPRPSNVPPLLPVFMHMVVPFLIPIIDQQQPPERAMNVELLVTVVSSALTAGLHFEWALRTVCGEERRAFTPPTSVLARRLAADLRTKKYNHTSATVMQRLTSSPSFIANFPLFLNELVT